MLAEKFAIGRSVVRLGAHVLWEKATRPRYESPDQITARAEQITPAWLTGAICGEVPGAQVESVRCAGGSDGSTSRRSLAVTYNEIGEKAGLPRRIFTKSTPHLRSRLTLGPSGKLANEIGFYRNVRPLLDIEATEALYAGFDPSSARSMIVFRDLAELDGCKFCDPTVYVDRSMAEDMVSLLAGYHGRMWESPLLADVMTTFEYQQKINRAMAFADRAWAGIERAGEAVPEVLRSMDREALWQGHMQSLELNAQRPLTLIHWDMHIGNWYVTRGGRMGLSDWGMYRGQWAGDYAYAMLSALTIEDRRAWEHDLLRLYLERLDASGGTAPDFDAAWLAVRQQAFHPLFYWLVTLGVGPLQADMQPDFISRINIERIAQGFVDHEAMASLPG